MRKILCILLAGALLGLWGCGDGTRPADTDEAKTTATHSVNMETEPELESGSEPLKDDPDSKWVELTTPLEYELLDDGFAKSKTHYYATHAGGILYAPISDLAQQEFVPLPAEYEGKALVNASICGITKEHLYVNLWEARALERDEYGNEWEDYKGRKAVTFRIALDSWEAEALLAETYDGILPWYHPAGDALLIPCNKALEIMPLDSRQRSAAMVDGEPVVCSGKWRNTLDGRATSTVGDVIEFADRADRYYVFNENNQASIAAHEDLSFSVRLLRYDELETPKNSAEKALIAYLKLEEGIRTYASCGEYLFFVQRNLDRDQYDLQRMKIDIAEDENDSGPLRENTNIFQLYSVGGKLFCQAYNPSVTHGDNVDEPIEEEIGIYLLDEQGKHAKTIFRYWDDHTGNSGYGLTTYGEHLMVTYLVIYGYLSVAFLYEPATGAMFPGGAVFSQDELTEHYYCPC